MSRSYTGQEIYALNQAGSFKDAIKNAESIENSTKRFILYTTEGCSPWTGRLYVALEENVKLTSELRGKYDIKG